MVGNGQSEILCKAFLALFMYLELYKCFIFYTPSLYSASNVAHIHLRKDSQELFVPLSAWTTRLSVVITCVLMGITTDFAIGLAVSIWFTFLNLCASKNQDKHCTLIKHHACLFCLFVSLVS